MARTITTIRLLQGLIDKIDQVKGTISRSEYIENLIFRHFEAQNTAHTGTDTASTAGTEDEKNTQNTEIQYLRSENTRLMELLHQQQSLTTQLQSRIPALPAPGEKKWYEFWK
jgi:hypothetical protein